jgi:hypothetical protein
VVTREDAIARARALADERGWTWLEPVGARRGRAWLVGKRRWTVTTNIEHIGASVLVVLDDATGAIVRAGFLPR